MGKARSRGAIGDREHRPYSHQRFLIDAFGHQAFVADVTVQMSNIVSADAAGIARAAQVLRRGGLVALPTETVYGLGADAANDKAVAGIFEAKRRPRFNPLIIHVRDLGTAAELAAFTPAATKLADCFWPGPLTLVLPRKPACPLLL